MTFDEWWKEYTWSGGYDAGHIPKADAKAAWEASRKIAMDECHEANRVADTTMRFMRERSGFLSR